jgi:hypothetical protein
LRLEKIRSGCMKTSERIFFWYDKDFRTAMFPTPMKYSVKREGMEGF